MMVAREVRRLEPEGGAVLRGRSLLASWLAKALGEAGPPPRPPEAAQGEPQEPAMRRVGRLHEWATADQLVEWESERVRLVVNAPGGIALPLEASWWLDGEVGGPTSAEVRRFLLDEGLRVVPGAGAPDALPGLLELAHVLLQHQVAAELTGRPELVERARSRERELVERFLLPWIPRACSAGRDATESPWWRAVLDLLEGFVTAEATRLGVAG